MPAKRRENRENATFNNVLFAVVSLVLTAFCVSPIFGQSSNQNFPTPVTTNEINGTIKARDIGDSRLTTYFYTFNGGQGDIFINVVTNNFNGDIDIFAVEGFKALTKVVIYADTTANETGRLIYLRKPEKLLLRVEGRSPNDDPATFRIKFGGSFVAAEKGDGADAPELPEIKPGNEGDVIVNSVGTIIGIKPKPTPAPSIAKVTPPVEKPGEPAERDTATAGSDETPADPGIKVVVSDNIPPAKKVEAPPKKEVKTTPGRRTKPPVKKTELPESDSKETNAENTTDAAEKKEEEFKPDRNPRSGKRPRVAPPPKEPPAPNPLENIRLVVIFKDGKKIERPMSEVLRFNVDKGILTIVLKDGTMSKHSILDVEKVTIE
jgi:hypothetical protein